MNEIEQLYCAAPDPRAFAQGYISYLVKVLERLDLDAVSRFIEVLSDARERNAQVFFVGNGGSASTASHFANDLSIGTKSWTKPLRATSLCDNVSIITALANDYGYADIFVRQLQVHLQSGDVVVAISASGNSPSIVTAIEFANRTKAISVGITGFDGGQLAKLSQVVVHVPTNPGEYGPAEDVHLILDHLAGAFLTCRFSKGSQPPLERTR